MATVGELEAVLARNLAEPLRKILPQTEGYPIRFEIKEGGRKKRKDARSWNPGSGEIVIRFDRPAIGEMSGENPPLPEQENPDEEVLRARLPGTQTTPGSHFGDFIKSLDGAEQRPGFDFVALKRFRDLNLTAEGYDWTGSLETRDQVLRTADHNGIVIIYKVPNPKAPAFPVTAIRLNRQHPEVVAVLGEIIIADSGFQPVDLPGETLSRTVLDERR